MLEAILLVLLFAFLGFAAVKVAIAVAMLLGFIVGALLRLVGRILVGVITLPIQLVRLGLTPEPRHHPRRPRYLPAPAALGTPCRNVACRCVNPAPARYCRRCGTLMAV